MDETETTSAAWRRRLRFGPLVLVGLTVVLNLWVTRAETNPVRNLNDGSFHTQMIRWADGRLEAGELPFDGWYPHLQMGSSLFSHYQSLPHTLTAATFGADRADEGYVWVLYLLWGMWPIGVYAGGRLLGMEAWAAAGAGAVAPLLVSAPGYGFEASSYTWQGLGLWPQLWGMWTLPLALGLSWRALERGRNYASAAATLAAAVAVNFLTGYLALAMVLVLIVVRPKQWVARLRRGALILGGAVAAAAWVIVPLLSDASFINRSPTFTGHFWTDSFGARQVLGWLFTGRLFDDGRVVVVSLSVAAGLVVCGSRLRKDDSGRPILALGAVSLLLFFGRPTLGPVVDLLPGGPDLMLHRFISGVHLAGIWLAGVGLAWGGRTVSNAIRSRLSPKGASFGLAGAAVVVGIVVGLAWSDLITYHRQGATWIAQQASADATDGADVEALVEVAAELGGGRIYAGLTSNWGRDYRSGFVPVYSVLPDKDVDEIGFTYRAINSLSTDIEPLFDDARPAHYELFNVRYLLLPVDREPPIPATSIERRGNHMLWRVATSGYLQVVDTNEVIEADRATVAEAATGVLAAGSTNPLPVVAFDGVSTAPPSVPPGASIEGLPGLVVEQSDDGARGLYEGRIVAERPAVVVLKVSFDPGWRVEVDGARSDAQMIGPSFLGVAVPAGEHLVSFRFESYPNYPILVALGVAALLASALGPHLIGRRRPGAVKGLESA